MDSRTVSQEESGEWRRDASYARELVRVICDMPGDEEDDDVCDSGRHSRYEQGWVVHQLGTYTERQACS